jgi:hypothetical protein
MLPQQLFRVRVRNYTPNEWGRCKSTLETSVFLGIIYVSATDLGWEPLIQSWLGKRCDFGANREVSSPLVSSVILDLPHPFRV